MDVACAADKSADDLESLFSFNGTLSCVTRNSYGKNCINLAFSALSWFDDLVYLTVVGEKKSNAVRSLSAIHTSDMARIAYSQCTVGAPPRAPYGIEACPVGSGGEYQHVAGGFQSAHCAEDRDERYEAATSVTR